MMPVQEPNPGGSTAGSSIMGFLTGQTIHNPNNMQYPQMDLPDTGLHPPSFLSREQLRPLSQMMGVGQSDPPPFGCVVSPPLLVQRVKHNVTYFYLNYAALVAVLFLASIFFSAKAWIGLIVLAALWIGMARKLEHDEALLKKGSLLMTGISGVVMLWLLGGVFWHVLTWGGASTLLHAMTRDASHLGEGTSASGGGYDSVGSSEPMGFYTSPQIVQT